MPQSEQDRASVPGLIVKMFTNSQRFTQFDSITPGDIYLLTSLKLVPVKKGAGSDSRRFLRCRSTPTTKIRKIISQGDLQEGIQLATPVGWQATKKLGYALSYCASLHPDFLHKIEAVHNEVKTFTGIFACSVIFDHSNDSCALFR